MKHARVNRSFKSGVTKKTVLSEIAGSMGFSIPTSIAEANALQEQFVSGFSLEGPSSAQMDRLVKSAGLEWSIQDDELQVINVGGVRQDRAWIVSADNGMVGSPELGAPTEPGKTATLTVTSLIYPELLPGSKIDLRSETLSGLYRVTRTTHTGDTHGDAWFTAVEAKPI